MGDAVASNTDSFLEWNYRPSHLSISGVDILATSRLKINSELIDCIFEVDGLVLAVVTFQVLGCFGNKDDLVELEELEEDIVLDEASLLRVN